MYGCNTEESKQKKQSRYLRSMLKIGTYKNRTGLLVFFFIFSHSLIRLIHLTGEMTLGRQKVKIIDTGLMQAQITHNKKKWKKFHQIHAISQPKTINSYLFITAL